MTRDNLLLAVLAAADGVAYKPAQLQKTVFLITQNLKLVDEGPQFSFEPYHYGPFDKNVYQEAEMLRGRGLVKIEPSGYGQWNTYAVTEEGLAAGRKILASVKPEMQKYIRDVSSWARSVSFATLVKSIYQQYPGMKVNSIFQG
jgi:uncharacterized protein YwgA